MRTWPFIIVSLCLASPALALTQPDGTTIPGDPGCDSGKPTGLGAVFACVCDKPGVCNIGAPCTTGGACDDGNHATCETTLSHDYNDNTCIPSKTSGLDPKADARTDPETFRPICPMTFTLVGRGNALFKDVFGWYNVTGTAPTHDDLHLMLGCNDAAGKNVVLDIQGDPAYKGNEIGFFLATPEASNEAGKCANGDCCATIDRVKRGEGKVYYSQRKFNPDAKGANSIIHLLTYDSKIKPRKFYFAWEDRFGGSDNTFTDLVTSVDGVECSGGGVPCDTKKVGICSFGITACENAVLVCTQIFQSSVEVCDAVDNDCNGQIDDNATCPDRKVCRNGRCVGSCGSPEFPCSQAGTVCQSSSGLCVPTNCVDVSCPAGKVCRDGQCFAPCEGVVCPKDETCVNDVCLDLCAGVNCGTGKMCRSGVCFDGCGSCNGAVCSAPLRCDAQLAQCIDPSCTQSCAPPTYCENGKCKDPCEGTQCPGGVACVGGKCQNLGPDGMVIGASDGNDIELGNAGTPGSNPLDPSNAAPAVPNGDPAKPACSCSAVGHHNRPALPLALASAAMIALLARRQGRRQCRG